MEGSGWKWGVLGVFIPLVGLAMAYAVARFLKRSQRCRTALGSLTESPAIGTASEAIRALSMADAQKQT
jgi:putative transport protein